MRRTNATPNTAMPKPGRHATRPTELRRERADRRRTRRSGPRCSARTARVSPTPNPTSGSRPASSVISGRADEDRRRPPRRSATSVATVARAGAWLPGEHQLPASGVLLAAQEPGRGEQRPDRADRRQEDEALVDGVPTDGVDRRDRARAGSPARCRRSWSPRSAAGSASVGKLRHVRQRRRRDGRTEHDRAHGRADPHLPEGVTRDGDLRPVRARAVRRAR